MDENKTLITEDDGCAQTAPYGTSFTAKLVQIFASPMMLVLAILISAVQVLNLPSFDLFGILLTVAAWILFAAAKKSTVNHNGLAIFSGVIKAKTILSYVESGLLFLNSIILIVVGSMITEEVATDILESIKEIVSTQPDFSAFLDRYGIKIAEVLSAGVLVAFFRAIGIVVLLIAVVMLVAGILYGKFHKFTKSLCVSSDAGEDKLAKVSFAKGFTLFLAILCALSALACLNPYLISITGFLADGCMCAAYFILYLIIGKNFSKQ